MKNDRRSLWSRWRSCGRRLGCGGGTRQPKTRRRRQGRRRRRRSRRSSAQKALDKFNARARRASTRTTRRTTGATQTCADVAKQFEAPRRRNDERQVPGGDVRRGARLPALRRRQGREGALPAGARRRPEVPLRARAARALPVQGGRQRRRGHQRARSRPSPTRKFQNVPALVDLAMFQMLRDSAQVGANCHRVGQGRRPAGLRLREAEPPARARHRRRLHAGVQPARALLLRQREEEGRRVQASVGPHDRDERGDRQARRRAAARARGARLLAGDAQEPELRAHPQHAGLIQNELGQVNTAVAEFPTAAQLDPHFFEAQMNSRRST